MLFKTNMLETLFKKYEGKIYYRNPDITEENFPLPAKIQKENWKLIKINRTMTTQEVLAEIKRQGCRPGNLYELLEWAKDNQEKGTYVVALGQIYKDSGGFRRVPHVHAYSDGDFEFNLGYFEDVWPDGDAFFCFCDDSTQALNTSEDSTLTLSTFVPHAPKIEKVYCYCEECQNFYKEWNANRK